MRRLALAAGIMPGLIIPMTAYAHDPSSAARDAAELTQRSPDAALTAFERTLARHESATEALAAWCAARGLAPDATGDPVIRAEQVPGTAPHVMDDMRRVLRVSGDEPLGYRHVRLMCGDHVLSDARNLYVPARLTAEMNRALAKGDRPFGAVIAPLAFRRERWQSRRGADTGCPEQTVLSQQALIRMRDGTPLAFVVECYQPAVLKRPG